MSGTSSTNSNFIARVRARSTPIHAVLLSVLCFLTAIPVLLVNVLPLSDYINHLARMYAIAVGAGDPWLSAFYRIEWQLIPNLAMDLVVPPLAKVTGVYVAGRIFAIATLFLMATGPIAIHFALHRRPNLWPLTAFLFVYNQIFVVGLMNYLMGAGLAMWGVAAWIMLRDRPLAIRVAVSVLFVGLTFLCHLSALGLYGLAIGSFELWAWSARGRRFDRRLPTDLVALILPALPVVPLLLGSATWGLAEEMSWSASGKLEAIAMIFRTYADAPDFGLLVLLVSAFVWAVRRGLVSFHPASLVLLVIGTTVFLAMPTVLFGSFMADQRLPIALFLMLLGFGRLDTRDPAIPVAFVVLIVTFTAIRVTGVALHWEHLARGQDDMRLAVSLVEPGSKILVAYADEPDGDGFEQTARSHAPCIAMIERSALVSTAFTVPGKQILRVREDYADRVDTEDGTPPNASQLVVSARVETAGAGQYWKGWEEKHDYLVILHTARDAQNPDPELLELVYGGEGFQLYAIVH